MSTEPHPPGTRCIPIAALPLDLQAAILEEERLARPGRSLRDAASLAGAPLVGAACFGVILGLFGVSEEAFRDPVRYVPLIAGAGAFGAWIFRRPARPRGALVGHASLVLVEGDHVRVVPAELVSQDHEAVRVNEKDAFRGRRSGEWQAELAAAIERATHDPRARDRDRWRTLADGAIETGARRALERRASAVLGAVLGVGLAVFLEAGPLHARDPSAEARADFSAVRERTAEVDRGLASWTAPATSWASGMQASTAAEARRVAEAEAKAVADRVAAETDKARADEQALAALAPGDIEGRRAFLAHSTSETLRLRATRELADGCAKAYGQGGGGARGLAVALTLRRLCVEGAPARLRFTYDATGAVTLDDVESFAASFARSLGDSARAAGRPMTIAGASAVAANERPHLALRAVLVGPRRSPKDPDLAFDQACQLTITALDDSGRPVPFASFDKMETAHEE